MSETPLPFKPYEVFVQPQQSECRQTVSPPMTAQSESDEEILMFSATPVSAEATALISTTTDEGTSQPETSAQVILEKLVTTLQQLQQYDHLSEANSGAVAELAELVETASALLPQNTPELLTSMQLLLDTVYSD